jgi:REP-associated tyrosine transposase
MSQSLARIYVHLIFSTKHREPLLSAAVQPRLRAYLATVLKNLGSAAVKVGGTRDHVHMLFRLSKNRALAETVERIKTSSSKWLKTQGRATTSFHWQSGYAAFSVSPAKVRSVVDYIARQEEHHRKVTFQEECRKFFESYGLEYDERYMWD